LIALISELVIPSAACARAMLPSKKRNPIRRRNRGAR
jgi:hypothetical protein